MPTRRYCVYILSSQNNNVLYIGVTGDLKKRIYEHQHDLNDGFTKKYKVHKLVHFERFHEVSRAIAREKQLKGWRREKKEALIDSVNPSWKDLSDRL